MKAILVTGGAGYIGSHACKALAAVGYLPVTYDSLVTGHRWAVQWGPFEHGDIRDAPRLTDVIRKHQPEAVMHFAASAYVGESVQDPLKYYSNNVIGSYTLFSTAIKVGIKGIVFSSSCATYGDPKGKELTEGSPQEPVNPYGRTKLIVEQMLRDFCNASPTRAVALRYFNAAGADFEGRIGELHDPETHLIPLVLRAAMRGKEGASVDILGNDYPTKDGTCVRDFVHVDDLADAHVKALEYLHRMRGFDAFNLGTGQGHSVLEVIKVVERVTGRRVECKYRDRRPGDPPELIALATKAASLLGWTPKRSDIVQIVSSACKWMDHLESWKMEKEV